MGWRCALGAVTGVLGLALCGCANSGSGAPAPSVVLVVIDTLRADHLSLDGYARPTSPRLAEWAKRGAYFERFYSHSAWTRPSVTTMLTGLLPGNHGIIRSGDGLNPSVPYLPRELRARGYDTAALVANPQIHRQLGFEVGFTHWEEQYPANIRALNVQPADLMAASDAGHLLAAARRRAATLRRPFFLYLHLLDPHGPYSPPPAFARRFTDPAYRGRVTGSLKDFVRLSGGPAPAADVAQFTALYDAEIASTDTKLARFLDWLETEGLLAGTHVFVTADHGEELLERGGVGHGGRLFEEQVRIPLLWIGPGVPAGLRVTTLAGLADITPTVRRIAGIGAREPRETAGIDLARILPADAAGKYAERAIFFEEPAPPDSAGADDQVLRGMVTAGRKLLASGTKLASSGCERLSVYDLLADPGERLPETVDCRADAGNAFARSFNRHLQVLNAGTHHGAPAAKLDTETEEQLKALGYLN